MICVTGAETTCAALFERLSLFEKKTGLQEIRLDRLLSLEGFSNPVDPTTLLLTCRPVREGGGFQHDEHARIHCLSKHTQTLRPGWVDIESSTPKPLLSQVFDTCKKTGTRVLVSYHDFSPANLQVHKNRLDTLKTIPCDAIKYACTIEDACELCDLHEILVNDDRPMVFVAMGLAGLLSRLLYPRFHSAWTYVAASEQEKTAPGQMNAKEFFAWRFPPPKGVSLYGLLGGNQIAGSPSMRVYNRLFSERGISARYLAIQTLHPEKMLPFLQHMGFRGLSITMPNKQRVVSCLSELDSHAKKSGVVNTVSMEDDGRLLGTLTDGLGAQAAIEQHTGPLKDKRVSVLGTGATALVIARQLLDQGAHVTVLGRDLSKARQIGADLGIHASDTDLIHQLPNKLFDILIHATPVGFSDPNETLVLDASILQNKVVLDTILGVDTKLLCDTRSQNGIAISGYDMWAEQGRLQIKQWLGMDVSASELLSYK